MAVKSFQGARATAKKVKPATILVRDIMTKNMICFTQNQTIHDVMKAFIKHRISGGPVVDDNCLLYTSPSPRDLSTSRMPSSA